MTARNELDPFQLLAALERPPLVVFTTAYDHYAVRAFEVNSVDYLLKPVAADRLQVTLARLERPVKSGGLEPWPMSRILSAIARAVSQRPWLRWVGTQSGENIQLLDVGRISHFLSEDRLVYAYTEQGRFLVTTPLAELETRLDPAQFMRIHRSAIVNLCHVNQVSRWFARGVSWSVCATVSARVYLSAATRSANSGRRSVFSPPE